MSSVDSALCGALTLSYIACAISPKCGCELKCCNIVLFYVPVIKLILIHLKSSHIKNKCKEVVYHTVKKIITFAVVSQRALRTTGGCPNLMLCCGGFVFWIYAPSVVMCWLMRMCRKEHYPFWCCAVQIVLCI